MKGIFMKIALPRVLKNPSRKGKVFIGISIIFVGLATGIVSSAFSDNQTHAVDSPLVTQVDNQGKELANHDARISNTENDVKDLQGKTDTAPSTTRVSVPTFTPTESSTQPPTQETPTQQTQQVTVTAYQVVTIDSNTTDCRFTYSDGTMYEWAWKTISPQGAWETDGQGQNGHWVQTTSTSGQCDQNVIGTTKVN